MHGLTPRAPGGGRHSAGAGSGSGGGAAAVAVPAAAPGCLLQQQGGQPRSGAAAAAVPVGGIAATAAEAYLRPRHVAQQPPALDPLFRGAPPLGRPEPSRPDHRQQQHIQLEAQRRGCRQAAGGAPPPPRRRPRLSPATPSAPAAGFGIAGAEASAQLMADIKAARGMPELWALWVERGAGADHVHVSCWLGRLAHARELQYSEWPALCGVPNGAPLLEQLLGRFLGDLRRHGARQASNCLWVIGRAACGGRGGSGDGGGDGGGGGGGSISSGFEEGPAVLRPLVQHAAGALIEALLLCPGALLLGSGGNTSSGGGGSGSSCSRRRGGANAVDAANTAWAMARIRIALERSSSSSSSSRHSNNNCLGAPFCVSGAPANASSGSSTSDGNGSPGSEGGPASPGTAASSCGPGDGGAQARLQQLLAGGRLWAALEEACLRQLPSSGPRELSAILWAFSAARQPAPRLFAAAAAHVPRVETKLNATHITSMAWAFAKQGCKCSSMAAAPARHGGGGGGGSNGDGGGGGLLSEGVRAVFDSLCRRAAADAPRFRAQALAVLLWSLAAARVPCGAGAGAARAAALAGAAVAEARAGKLSGQGLALVAHAVVDLGLLPVMPRLASVLCREALFRLDELRPLGTVRLLRLVVEERRLALRRAEGAACAGGADADGALAARTPWLKPAGAARPSGSAAGAVVGTDEAAEAAVAAALAAVAATHGRSSSLAGVAADARGRPPAPLCRPLFMRELLRRAVAQLPHTSPATLLHQLQCLAALREAEPRPLRAMAAAAAVAAARGAYAPAAAAALVHALAALQQPCGSLWRSIEPALAAAAVCPTDATGGDGLSPEQLVGVVWAAAAAPGAAADARLWPLLRSLVAAAWRHAPGLEAEAAVRLTWASASLLSEWAQQRRCRAPRPALAPRGVRALDRLAADAEEAAAWGRVQRLLPGLLTEAEEGRLGPFATDRRAELLHAVSMLLVRQQHQQQHEQRPAPGFPAGTPVATLQRRARMLAEDMLDHIAGPLPPSPRALLLLLRCHAAAGSQLRDGRAACAHAAEALRRLREFGLQAALDALEVLTGAPGGPGAAAGVSGLDLVAAAAQQLRARLPYATSSQLTAVVRAGAALAAGSAGGSGERGAGLAVAAAKLLAARRAECSARELAGAAAALAALHAAGGTRSAVGSDGPALVATLVGAAAAAVEAQKLHAAPAAGPAGSPLAAAQRTLTLLRIAAPTAAAGGGAGGAAGAEQLVSRLCSELSEAEVALGELPDWEADASCSTGAATAGALERLGHDGALEPGASTWLAQQLWEAAAIRGSDTLDPDCSAPVPAGVPAAQTARCGTLPAANAGGQAGASGHHHSPAHCRTGGNDFGSRPPHASGLGAARLAACTSATDPTWSAARAGASS